MRWWLKRKRTESDWFVITAKMRDIAVKDFFERKHSQAEGIVSLRKRLEKAVDPTGA